MLPRVAGAALGALLRPGGGQLARTLASAAAAGGGASGGLQFCVVGSGPAGFYTADKVRGWVWCGRGMAALCPPEL
jgi:hypothetical protein